MIELRPYQEEAKESIFSNYNEGIIRQLLVLATGLGKTTIGAKIIEHLPLRLNCAGKVLWLTHEESLIEQSAISIMCSLFPEYASEIRRILVDEEGVIGYFSRRKFEGNNSRDIYDRLNKDMQARHIINTNLGIVKQRISALEARVVVASVQTMYNRINNIPEDLFDMVICDEAHLFASKTYSTVVNHFKPKIRLGLTATPDRLDGVSLGDLFDKIVFERDLKFGINNGYLCELEAIMLETNIDLSNAGKTAGDFNKKDLSLIVDTPVRNLKIVRKWEEVAKYRPTIAFCVDVEHAQNLSEQFRNCGYRSTFVVADETICPDRKKRITDFKNGKYDVLTNVMILTAGFDYPDIGCVIPASPTMSVTRYLQQIGRGTRKKTAAFVNHFGKNNCIIIDPTDNSRKHSVVNTWSLDKANPRIEDKLFMGAEKKADLIGKRDKRKLSHVQEKEERFFMLALPKPSVRLDAPWMKRPATEKQLQWLAKEGYDIENQTYTQGQCNQIILSFQCSIRELEFLKANGYDVSNGATKAQFEVAQKAIAQKNTVNHFNSKLQGNKNPFKGIS